MSLHFRKLVSSDLDQLDEHLIVHFFSREPICTAFGLTEEKWFRPWIRKLTQPYIEELQITWGCYEGDKLVGVILNGIECKDKSKSSLTIGDVLRREIPDHPLIQADQFIENILYEGVDLFEKNMDTLVHLYFLSVDGNYGRRGIGKKLIELSLQEALDKGIKGCYGETTGKYSGKIFEQLGFKNIRVIKYKDYEETSVRDLGEHDTSIVWRKIL